jgi:hypothetical protein
MIELADAGNRVLWLNSIATRAPKLTSGRDIRKIFRRLGSMFKGAERVRDNLWVYSPVVLPLPHSRIAQWLNRRILRFTIGRLRRQLGLHEFQLWTFLPNTAEYIGTLGESVSVYYCVDEWSKFSYVDGSKLAEAERQLIPKANVIFATAQSLVDARLPANPNTHLARHGVDHALFATALDENTRIPADIADLPAPVIGFYGTIQDWVDLDLIAHIARTRPDWSIAMIGEVRVDIDAIKQLPNVHFLGRKPHDQLPAYCRALTVGLIPQKVNALTLHMNPIKLREYLSAGLTVVATNLPEISAFAAELPASGLGNRDCQVASDYDTFVRCLTEAIANESPQRRSLRSNAMRNQTWHDKVRQVADIVMRTKNRNEDRNK